MRKICIVLVVLLASSISFAAPPAGGKVWQYAVIMRISSGQKNLWGTGSLNKHFQPDMIIPDVLDLMGADGWELVSVDRDGNAASDVSSTTFYFKRPK